MIKQTIAAISTPLGPGGIGIIRVSGPDAYPILQRLFVRRTQRKQLSKSNQSYCHFQSHIVYYGHIMDPVTENIIDEVLAVFMKGPKSFTREDVVEIHSHSGYVVLDRILSAVVDSGADLSGPGDFTKRAFLNGRIDLSQAESVIDLINAPCETAAQMASEQVAGGLREFVEKISDTVVELQAQCEARIEFGEETDDGEILIVIENRVKHTILPEILRLIQRQKDTAVFREGLHLAIAGVPNVGKSSLLNKLVEREAAIVSEFPGTTRDIVREYISINGVPVVVCDTAGIQESIDPVECIGIEKAREQVKIADLVLIVIDGSRTLNTAEKKILVEAIFSKTIVVINKDDLINETSLLEISKLIENFRHIRVSAKFGTNIESLKSLIFDSFLLGDKIQNDARITPNLRQRKILEKASLEFDGIVHSDKSGRSIDVVSEKLTNVLRILEEISGNRDKEELYNQIFSQFCIGK